VEIRIGIANTGRELSFESADSAQDVQKAVSQALDSGATHVSFTDNKGNTFVVPTAGLAYVEIGTEETRRIGFVG